MSYLSVSSPISGIAGKRNEFIQAYVNHFVCLAYEIGFDYLLKLRKQSFSREFVCAPFSVVSKILWSKRNVGANRSIGFSD